MTLPFGIYKKQLRPYSDDPVCLSVLMKPFGIEVDSSEIDTSLSIGSLLKQMSETFYAFDCIDPMDLAEVACQMGFKPAGNFLETGPLLLMDLLLKRKAHREF